jgi:transcriptional regulator with XRE-family HTH domain
MIAYFARMTTKTIYADSYRDLITILRDAREKAGITQEILAQALGEDQSFVSKVERRERRLDLEELRRFCEALGLPLSEIVARWEAAIHHVTGGRDLIREAPPADSGWSATNWKNLLEWFVTSGLLTYKEVAALTLGHLNPSQVGTSIASKKSFQAHYPPRQCWSAVRDWHFKQTGKCADCGSRLELQADHIDPRQELGDEADRLENMTLRCRRCNVIRRPSHKQGGLTFLTAEAGLMWILFTKRPRTYQEFERHCRDYGMTMANIRFQESWAMARWLAKEGLYEIDPASTY